MSDDKPGRCASCRHWDAEPHSENMGVRRCTRVLQWWDATEWAKDEDGDDIYPDRVWTAAAEGVLAFANDGSSYSASLLTRPEFGCVMWVAKAREGTDPALRAADEGEA